MKLYINNHVLERIRERRGDVDFNNLPNFLGLVIQRRIRDIEINKLKGALPIKGGFLIVEIFRNKIDNTLVSKAVTFLTNKQMKLSRNFGKGNHLAKVLKAEFKAVFEDVHFDRNNYSLFLPTIKWTEEDVIRKCLSTF